MNVALSSVYVSEPCVAVVGLSEFLSKSDVGLAIVLTSGVGAVGAVLVDARAIQHGCRAQFEDHVVDGWVHRLYFRLLGLDHKVCEGTIVRSGTIVEDEHGSSIASGPAADTLHQTAPCA